jgi:hypothetical protein
MKISVITPTGGRPLAFKLCELWMSRQTQQPDEWIVVDDYPVATECTMGQTVIRREPFWTPDGGITLQKNLIEGLKAVTGDIVIIIEDDDWYHPNYIKNIAQKFEQPMEENKFPHLVGGALGLYYNINNYSYQTYNNIHHASFCQTAFSSNLIPQVSATANFFLKETWLDIKLWKFARCNKLTYLSKSPLTIGIKGLPGRPGAGEGHKFYLKNKTMPFVDEQPFEMLEKWIGTEDVQIYKEELLKTKSNLILHVGLHKTGTTTIQNFLHKNRNELLKHGVFYPDVGIWGSQHGLFPVSAWPHENHSHPFLKKLSKNQLDLENLLDLLKKDLDIYKSSLTIMSSEVWSEICFLNTSFPDLMSQIKPLFNKVTIFVSKRNFDQLALSALKHNIRHRRHEHLVKNKEYIKFYFDRLNDTKNVYNFWENCGLPLIVKNLEEASGNLVDYYFGDIVEEYSKDARLILQNYEEEIINTDKRTPHSYLLNYFLHENKNKTEIDILKNFIEVNKENFKDTTNDQLILYFKYFEKIYQEDDLNNITWEDKMSALKFAKILE